MLVWLAEPSSDVLEAAPGWTDWSAISAGARARGTRLLRGPDRRDFIAGRVAAAICVAAATGTAAARVAIAQRCPRCGSDDHGPPALAGRTDAGVSWSHSAGHVAAAASDAVTDALRVGIDIERRTGADDIPWTALTQHEAATVRADLDPPMRFLDLWVRKEAVIKARRLDLDALPRISGLSSATEQVDRISAGPRMLGAIAALPQPHRRLSLGEVHELALHE